MIEATIAGGSYSTLSTDVEAGPEDQFKPVGETLGDVDPVLNRVLDVETARPLIAALPDQQRTVLTLRFFANMMQYQIAERMGYSQMHISRYSPRRSTRCAVRFVKRTSLSPRETGFLTARGGIISRAGLAVRLGDRL